ncbi:MAG: Arm DNA-binding domain-containing protein, partial [Wenzhouxiangellaceae bacterium]
MRVKPSGARSWILRAMVGDRRRDYGLGGFPAVTLAQARDRAREYREMIFQGLDPAVERRKRQDALKAEQEVRITFA